MTPSGVSQAILKPQVHMRTIINLNLSISDPHFVCQISQPPNMAQKGFCIQISQMDLSFKKKKQFVIPWLTSYANFYYTGEFRCFYLKRPVTLK